MIEGAGAPWPLRSVVEFHRRQYRYTDVVHETARKYRVVLICVDVGTLIPRKGFW